MLSTFRRKLSSWLVLGFLFIAIVAMVITGFGTGGVGGLPTPTTSGETIAEVNGEEIGADELERMIRRELERARQQTPELDIDRFLEAGAFEGLLEQLIVGRALWAFGREQGLIVSQRMIDTVIANIPEFHNFAGQFDEGTFRQALQAQRMTEAQLRQEIGHFLMQRQLQMPIGMAARVPDSIAVQYASLMLERRRGTIGVVPTEAMAQGIAPTDAEVAAFYAQNRTRYTVPERRVLRYALIGRDQLGDAARATDEEIAAHYRQNAARYAGTETRTLQQVVLPDEAAARALLARAGGGANFAQAAGENLIRLEGQNRDQFAGVSSRAVADAVFAAAQGAMIGPIRSDFGWHVVRVEAVNRGAGRPLQAVRAEIAAEIERRKLEDALGGAVSRVEEKLGDASFEEIVRDERLTVVETPPVTATGAAPGVQFQAQPELAQLLRGAFQMDPEAPEPVIETITPNERYALLSVARVIPAAVPPLQQIAAQVRADVVRQRANERARALAARIVERINSGVPARQAFAEAGVRLPAPQPVNARRIEISQGREVPPPLVMMFSIPQRSARQLQAPNGAGWFVVHLEERTAGQAECPRQAPGAQPSEGCRLIESARQQFGSEAGTEYTEQFARAIQRGAEISRNEQAIRQTRQRLQAGAAVQ
jgi:peptidyl-prolyl cis-trans isomerase D